MFQTIPQCLKDGELENLDLFFFQWSSGKPLVKGSNLRSFKYPWGIITMLPAAATDGRSYIEIPGISVVGVAVCHAVGNRP